MNTTIDFSNNDIDKSLPYISISQVLDSIEIPFDSERVAKSTYNNHHDNPESQYYQKTVDEIIKMWNDKGATACKYGSLLDDYIGSILENETFFTEKMDDRLYGLKQSFDNFYELMMKSGDVEYIAREQTLYYPIEINGEKWLVKGRFDALFYNKRINKYIIIDWKSSGSVDRVKTKWTKNFEGPMNKYPALNWYRYTNQLHFYKLALLNKYLPDCKPDDIVVMIVNLPGHIIEESNTNYMVYKNAIDYDETLMNELFKYAINKKITEEKELNKASAKEQVNEMNNIIENIF